MKVKVRVNIGLLKVMTMRDDEADPHDAIIEARFPGLKVISRCIEHQPEGIYDEETEKMALPRILELGKRMEKEGISALIVDCASDPGVDELRKILKVPVIGAGSSAASLALSIGTRVGTLGIREDAPKIMKKILGSHLVGAVKPEGVRSARDLMTEKGRENSIAAGEILINKGIDVICLACTGYSRLGIDEELRDKAKVPVIDALKAAGLFAWYWGCGAPNCLLQSETASFRQAT